ncbi:YHS domain-containing (seleno)protein [Devosia sp.]|uniref:YHS domain-containing (seleno)protein n=1 Tax=Devosia sp. TaxID=1871048 RepID=UPI003266A543
MAWLLLAVAARAEALVTTIVTDPLTGVAMEGYDPVSYFIDPAPQHGLADYEYVWQGVPWYFESAANRDVFMRNPSVYAPQFGGHCVMSVSRGYLSDGKPGLYAVDALKLYFFYSSANRDAFLLSKKSALASANANWPGLSADLMGPSSGATMAGTLASVAPASTGDNVQNN